MGEPNHQRHRLSGLEFGAKGHQDKRGVRGFFKRDTCHNQPISSFQMGQYFQVDGKQLQQQYKEHISNYHQWDQKRHAGQWMLFEKNRSPHLSIDETVLSNGELYTIFTNGG